MRTMLRVTIPMEAGNRAFKDGSLGKVFESFMQQFKPESAYFYPESGRRAALFVFDLADSSDVPPVAERFFLGLEADVYMTPVMNADDLQAGLQKASQ